MLRIKSTFIFLEHVDYTFRLLKRQIKPVKEMNRYA